MSKHTAIRSLMLVSALMVSACSQAYVWSLPPNIVATLTEHGQHQGHGGQTTGKPKEKPKEKAPPAQHQHTDPKKPTQHDQHKDPKKPMQHDMGGMQMGSMKGTQGDWSMNRQGSGTSWIPDTSPMFMKMLPSWNGFEVNFMGSATLNYADAGGRRGDSQLFSNSMAMLMARREYGDGGVLGLQFMASLDPLFNGKKGYPNLFQTGETANGEPLKDRQHPHDLISEVALSYSRPITSTTRAIGYFGLVGEPALGGSMFLMRPSGMENPEAPISHHWFDSSHITFGVATLGLSFDNKWKVEASTFNGTEPDEDRYDIDTIKFDSYSGRLSFNPNENWSYQVSYGFLKEPEDTLEPGVSQHRLTASAMYNLPLSNGDNLSLAFLYGQNTKAGEDSTNAFALEGTYYRRATSFFARFERVEKDELVDVPEGTYTINKFTFGAVHDFMKRGGFDIGLGGFVGVYAFPSSLEPFYGKSPVSLGVFLRIRPSRMEHEKMDHQMTRSVLSRMGD